MCRSPRTCTQTRRTIGPCRRTSTANAASAASSRHPLNRARSCRSLASAIGRPARAAGGCFRTASECSLDMIATSQQSAAYPSYYWVVATVIFQFSGSSRNRVGGFPPLRVTEALDFLGWTPFPHRRKLVTMRGWANSSDSRTSTGSPDSTPGPRSGVSSAIPGRWSSHCTAAEKNALRGLRARVPFVLRPTPAARPRHLLWRPARLPRPLDAPGRLPLVWRSEARTAGLVGGQPALYQAVRLLRREAVPGEHRPGDRRGTPPQLAHRQGAGPAVHAGATPPGGLPGAAGHRHRRDGRRQGPQLLNRGKRAGARADDMVRRRRA